MAPDATKDSTSVTLQSDCCSSTATTTSNTNNNNLNDNIKNHNEIIKNSSPVSEKSQHISIVSLDDDDDSSIADSDSDCDFQTSANDALESVFSTYNKANPHVHDGMLVLSQKLHDETVAASKPNIGSIALNNSTDITFGDKNAFHGPVVIQKFIYDKNRWKATGEDNPNFEESNGNIANKTNDNEPPVPEDPASRIKLFIKRNRLFVLLAVSGFLIISILIIGLSIGLAEQVQDNYDRPVVSKLRMVSRDEWIAQPPNNPLNNLTLPVGRIIIAHSVTEGCETQAQCAFRVRTIQTYHIESRNFDDIGYNFMVGGDGAAYEGRGWLKEGAHTKGYNKGTICIAFLGTFNKIIPPQRQLNAAKLLIEEGVNLGHIKKDYKLYGHRAFFGTESPGDALYNIIKEWPQFTEAV